MRLGLYGLIGSGKTTALNYLSKNYDLEILDLDEISKEIMNEEVVLSFVMANFPTSYNQEKNQIDRNQLRIILFNSLVDNQKFAAFVWPLIETKTKSLLNSIPIDKNVVVEGALLPLFNIPVEYLVEIQTPKPILIKRIMQRDQRESDETKKIAQIQEIWLQDFRGDIILNNDDSLESFYNKLDTLMMNFKVSKL
ncbi:dephospho-CoA kinase [Entomoplasma freundtii]|uniref:Dephospho-CoA kinase n=1 Tax=Entomoplasma freundtii TaxID=74700 RepID=A0A2K8NT54_9MOLU|nr:dephospho-CoA kinase [Entomoplasma freundtii]ATZ16358.1 dephospho-CoA kinase [Entomoplasma freundtii]TDY56603.1 dephospho-CoA kinase [Entomoplasma freundtii]